MFVQTILHPSLTHYNYDHSNGFNWNPPVSTYTESTNNNWGDVNIGGITGLFGVGSGGGSSDW